MSTTLNMPSAHFENNDELCFCTILSYISIGPPFFRKDFPSKIRLSLCPCPSGQFGNSSFVGKLRAETSHWWWASAVPPPKGTKIYTTKREWDELVQDFRYQLQFGCIRCAPSVSYECQRLYVYTLIYWYCIYCIHMYIYTFNLFKSH